MRISEFLTSYWWIKPTLTHQLQRYLEAMEAKETEKKFLQYVGKIAVDWPTIREKELQEVRNMLNITSTVDKFQLQIANNFSDFTVQ